MYSLSFALVTQVSLPMLVVLQLTNPLVSKVGDWLYECARLLQQDGELDWAIAAYQQVLPELVAAEDSAGVGRVLNQLGLIYGQQGDADRMQHCCGVAAGILADVGDLAGEIAALYNMGIAYDRLGNYEQAQRSLEKALSLQIATGDRAGESASFQVLGHVYQHLAQPKYAMCCYLEAVELCQILGDRSGAAINLSAIAALSMQHALPWSALDWYQQALEIFQALGDVQHIAQTLSCINQLYAGLEQLDGIGLTQGPVQGYDEPWENQSLPAWNAIDLHATVHAHSHSRVEIS